MDNVILVRVLKATAMLFGVIILSLAATLPSLANDSPNRAEIRRVDFDGHPNMEVICSIVEFMPGDEAARHFHHGIEAAYVLRGAMIQEPGKEPRMLATGTNIVNLRDVFHAGFKIIGNQSLKLYTVHIVDKGQPLYDPVK